MKFDHEVREGRWFGPLIELAFFSADLDDEPGCPYHPKLRTGAPWLLDVVLKSCGCVSRFLFSFGWAWGRASWMHTASIDFIARLHPRYVPPVELRPDHRGAKG